MKFKFILLILPFIYGCATPVPDPIIKEDQLEVSRKLPMGNCEELGLLRGTTISIKGTQQDALADLKQTAMNKGANYLKVEEFSAMGTSATGIAYKCY